MIRHKDYTFTAGFIDQWTLEYIEEKVLNEFRDRAEFKNIMKGSLRHLELRGEHKIIAEQAFKLGFLASYIEKPDDEG